MSDKPDNLLIIMSDEHQSRALSCADHVIAKTPVLDSLAADGMRFTNAYTPCPICVPARASFATGQYVHQTRLWDNAMPYTGATPSWGHALQQKGISVESIGKLHYRDEEDDTGFDVQHIPMMVANGVGMVWASIRKEDERIYGPKRMFGDYIGPGDSNYTKYDAAVTNKTMEWFDDRASSESSNEPWCLYVGLVAPHFPLVVPEEFLNLYPLDNLPEPKLQIGSGYERHPWVEKQNAFMDSESKFKSPEERLTAIACYYGLCSFMDNNVGKILESLNASGFGDNTTVIYTSDHGDNVGARGLWGKSNMYEESAAVPLIISGRGYDVGTCDTPVSILDISETIVSHFDTKLDTDNQHRKNLKDIATQPYDSSRIVFSEYHAAGSVSGAYMVRQDNWKYIYYQGFSPELFDLNTDPEELYNLATDPAHKKQLDSLHEQLLNIVDPDQNEELAHADQSALIERLGGRDKALNLGAPGATPPPDVS